MGIQELANRIMASHIEAAVANGHGLDYCRDMVAYPVIAIFLSAGVLTGIASVMFLYSAAVNQEKFYRASVYLFSSGIALFLTGCAGAFFVELEDVLTSRLSKSPVKMEVVQILLAEAHKLRSAAKETPTSFVVEKIGLCIQNVAKDATGTERGGTHASYAACLGAGDRNSYDKEMADRQRRLDAVSNEIERIFREGA